MSVADMGNESFLGSRWRRPHRQDYRHYDFHEPVQRSCLTMTIDLAVTLCPLSVRHQAGY